MVLSDAAACTTLHPRVITFYFGRKKMAEAGLDFYAHHELTAEGSLKACCAYLQVTCYSGVADLSGLGLDKYITLLLYDLIA